MTEKTYPPLPKWMTRFTIPTGEDMEGELVYLDDAMHAYYDLGRDTQTQAAPAAATLDLTPVIRWLENGCDPKEAVKELRILSTRMASMQYTIDRQAQKIALLIADRDIPQGAVVWPTIPPSMGQSPVLFEDGYAEGWAKCLAACQAALTAAQRAAPVEQEDSLDAARYRWLRDRSRVFQQDPDMSGNHYWMVRQVLLRGPTLDAAIDTARAQGKETTHDN